MISLSLIAAGFLLSLYQFVAALPWLWAIDQRGFAKAVRQPMTWLYAGLGLLGAGVAVGAYMGYVRDAEGLTFNGRVYASILHLQLVLDFLVLAPELLLLVWPKGGAIAMASFREGFRQPMFWLLILAGFFLITFSMVIPYFTFGDDYKMMKQLGFDTVMLSSVMFAVLAASISINEEIEGRTAITVMSKPITRRQFLIGKYMGILMAAAGLTMLLGWWLNWALYIKPFFDKLDEVKDQMPVDVANASVGWFKALMPGQEGAAVASGVSQWFGETISHGFGQLLGFGQVMVLLAIATALATQMSFVLNIVICLVIFFMGHLSPVLVQVTQNLGGEGSVMNLVGFVAQLFDTVLPALEFFNMGPAIIRDNSLEFWPFALYVLTVLGYAVMYSAIG